MTGSHLDSPLQPIPRLHKERERDAGLGEDKNVY